MCLSNPKIPSTPMPQAPQPADINQLARSKNAANLSGLNGGSLLTSPSGIANNVLTTGAPSLLGS